MYNDAGIGHVAADRTTIYEAVDNTGPSGRPMDSPA